jgi:hypothetical protein
MNASRSWIAASLLLGGIVLTAWAPRAESSSVHRMNRSFPAIGGFGTAGAPAPCTSVFGIEPVLLYDSTGSSLIGPVHEGLIVYSDGTAIRTRKDAQDAGDAGTIQVRNVGSRAARMLQGALLAAGAAQLCDDPTYVADVPMAKLTLFEGLAPDSAAHTVCYWRAPVGDAQIVEGLVRNFLATQFPGD